MQTTAAKPQQPKLLDRTRHILRLRVKDVDFARHEITVRSGKGQKDRVTMLPGVAIPPLREQIDEVRRIQQQDLQHGYPFICEGAILPIV